MTADAIEAGDHRDILSPNSHEPVFWHLNPRVSCEFECKDFTRGNVPCIVRLRKLRNPEPVMVQADRRFRTRSAKRRPSPKQKAQILGRFSLGMNCIRCAKERVQTHQRRQLTDRGGKEWTIGRQAEAQSADPWHIVQCQHIVDVAIWFLRQNSLANGALYEHSPPTVGTRILNGSEESCGMMHAPLSRKRSRINGKGIIAA